MKLAHWALAAACAGPQEEDVQTRWEAFPVFVWRLEYSGHPAPEGLLAPFGGTNVEGAEEAEWVLKRGLDFYVGHAPGRDDLHLEREYEWYDALWKTHYEERDASVLVRVPCLSEAATLESLEAQLGHSLRARGGANGLMISLGDEVGLTPYGDPFDLCAGEACRAAFSNRAANEELPFVGTDAVRRAWVAGDDSELGAWLARRRFHQEVVLDLFERLAARSRELAPDVPVGLVGLQGRTAFGGLAIERALEFLDVLEVYRTADARELMYTLRTPEQRALATIFPDETSDGPAWQVFDHWMRGADGLVIWCDRDLAQIEGYHARLSSAVQHVRAWQAELPELRSRPAGLALVHSPDSIALTWLRESLHDGPTWPRRFAGYHEQHGARELDLRAWLRLAEDCGMMPGSLPIEDLGARSVARFPLLIASHMTVVGEPEGTALAAFVEAGGRLIVQGPFAERDALGRALERDVFAELHALAPGRVERAPEGFEARLDRYLELRGNTEGAAGAGLRSELRARAASSGVRLPPFTLRAEPELGPLFIVQAAEGAGLYAVLPNAIEPTQRAALRDARLELELPAQLEVEWIHPLPDSEGRLVLPAGDPAIFRLRPR